MPSIFTTDDINICKKSYELILNHFKETKDNYFVVHNRNINTVTFYWTGYEKNLLNENILPLFKEFKLDTYGGVSLGATRIGFKAHL